MQRLNPSQGSRAGRPRARAAPNSFPSTFEIIHRFDQSSDAKVMLVRSQATRALFVHKIVQSREKTSDGLYREPTGESYIPLRYLPGPHPNIIRTFDSRPSISNDRFTGKFIVTLEWCDNGDLSELIQRLIHQRKLVPEAFALLVFVSILDSLLFLHHSIVHDGRRGYVALASPHRPVCHRDIKPENIFVADGGKRIVLGDLGEAYLDGDCEDICGTAYYFPPELRCGPGANPRTIKWTRADMWEFAATMHELLTLVAPRRMATPKAPIPRSYTNASRFQRIITQCLAYSPRDRPRALDLLDDVIAFRTQREIMMRDGGSMRRLFASSEFGPSTLRDATPATFTNTVPLRRRHSRD